MPKQKTHSANWGGKRPGAGLVRKSVKLSVNEALLLVDALNGILIQPELAERLIPLEVAEAIRLDGLDAKWQVDSADLIRRLSHLSHDAALDLLQRVDQFWQDAYHVSDGHQRVKEVGLAQTD